MVEVGVARVYAIRSPDGLFCYIGSTTGSLRCRLTRHKWRADSKNTSTSMLVIKQVRAAYACGTEAQTHFVCFRYWSVVVCYSQV